MHSRSLVWPALALVLITAVWGSTFFMIKDLVTEIPPLDFLGVRFAIAAGVVILLRGRALARCSARTWKRGLIAGGVYAAAQVGQTYGLQYADASVSGFITGMYVVLTPVLLFVLLRRRTPPRVWVAVGLASAGLSILSLRGLHLGLGEALTFLAACLYAVHIVLLDRWAGAEKGLDLASIQMIAIGAICGTAGLFGGVVLPRGFGGWASLLYMALVAGLVALVVQTWAQSRIPAESAAIIMTSEPVFAAAFAILLGGESLTWRLGIGGALVLGAMLLAEIGGGKGGRKHGGERKMKRYQRIVRGSAPSAKG